MLRQTLRGLLLLCGLPALFLLGLGGYVKLAQPHPPASAPLRVSVDRDILWPWQEARLRVEFNPARPVRPTAQPLDLVLILDTSSSLADRHLSLAKEAAATFLRNIDAAAGGTRVGVVQFAGTAKLMSGLSADIPAIIETIKAMGREAGDGTQFLPPLEQALSLLDKSYKAKVVLLTDGVAQEDPVSLRAFYEKDWKPSGHELFLLGVGADVDYDTLAQLTDDPLRFVVTSLDEAAPGAVFNEVARALGNFLGSDGRLHLPLSEPLVESVPTDPDPGAHPEIEPLPVRGSDQSLYTVSPLFVRDYHWVLGLAPKLGGVLRVLHEPVQLDYLDAEGRTNALLAADQTAPLVLAITPAMLFYLLLPALLYLLAQLLAWLLRPRGIIPDLAPIPRRRPLLQVPPPPLLRYPVEQGRRVDWSPGLVIGLGRSGRHVLTHLQQAIADTRDVPSGRPILLAVDVARDEIAQPETVPGCLDPLVTEALFLLPEGACKLQNRVHEERIPTEDPAAALDLGRFQNFGAEALSLRHGTNGEGALARLALLNDLRQGEQSALLERLRTALDVWRQLRPDVPERQIMVVANVEGGLARGWLTDLLVLMRRLVAEDEERGQAVEIILLLLGSAEVHDLQYISLSPSQAGSIFDELDRLASAGRLPFRHALAPPGIAEVLDGIVDRRPQDEVLVLGGPRDRWDIDLFPMAADSLLLLLDRQQRTDLTVALEALKQEENRCRAEEGVELYTEVKLHSAAIPRSVLVRLLGLRLQEVLAQEILFPGLTDSAGALRLPPLGENKPSFPLEQTRGPTPAGLEALLILATDGSGAGIKAGEEEVVSEAGQDFVLYVQETWKAYLQGREWNLATLVQAARQAANNLRHYANAGTSSLAQTLEHLADQTLSWVALLLGPAVADAMSGDVNHATSTGRTKGWLPEVIAEYTSTRQRLDEWQKSPARVALDVVPRGTSGHPEDALLQHWLRLWLGAPARAGTDPLQTLARRCRWELETSGVEGARLGLSLAFFGTKAFRYPPTPAGLNAFRNTLHAHIDDSLGLLTETQVLSALAKATAATGRSPAEAIAARLKGDLRGSRATLFVSMPGPDASSGPRIDTLRRELQEAFEGQAGAAEIVRFHESLDPYRMHAWNLMSHKRAEPRRPLATTPVHRYERARHDYAQRLAQELGLTEVDLPAAAGLGLSDPAKLKQFAGLWLGGKVWQDGRDGTYYLRVADGHRWPLTFFPQEGLAEAAARFVFETYPAAAEGTGMPVIDCSDPDGMQPFAALLCLMGSRSKT